ncbi:MAG: hypothetical protein MZV70_56900 [Desulfobacterales bacterium]|nr:hypothetical protein [Desulfobacterales bacterium]
MVTAVAAAVVFENSLALLRLLPDHRQHGRLLDPQLPGAQGLRDGGRQDRPAGASPWPRR